MLGFWWRLRVLLLGIFLANPRNPFLHRRSCHSSKPRWPWRSQKPRLAWGGWRWGPSAAWRGSGGSEIVFFWKWMFVGFRSSFERLVTCAFIAKNLWKFKNAFFPGTNYSISRSFYYEMLLFLLGCFSCFQASLRFLWFLGSSRKKKTRPRSKSYFSIKRIHHISSQKHSKATYQGGHVWNLVLVAGSFSLELLGSEWSSKLGLAWKPSRDAQLFPEVSQPLTSKAVLLTPCCFGVLFFVFFFGLLMFF